MVRDFHDDNIFISIRYVVQVKVEGLQDNLIEFEKETVVKQDPDPSSVVTSKRGRKQRINEPEYLTDVSTQVETKEEDEEFQYEDASPDDSDAPLIDTVKVKRARVSPGRKKRSKSSRKKLEVPTQNCCCLCQAIVDDESELKSHVESFHQTQIQAFLQTKYHKYTLRHKYECQYCHRRYTRKGSLDKHFELPDYEEPPRKRYGEPRKKVKTGDNGAVCTVCGKMYYDKYDLELHELRMHATERPIACLHPGCEKKFAAEKLMRKHFRFHGERKHICETCGKGFIEPNDLRNHSYVHKKIKPLQCPLCPRTFTHKPVLETHILAHSGQNIFACEQCDKTYKWKEDLRKHFMAEHLGIFPYKCKFCGKGYTGSSNRTYHEKRCNNYLLKQETVIGEAGFDRTGQHSIIISPNQSLGEMTGI